MKLQRIERIGEYLREHGKASLNELCEKFGVSKNTIRRDISVLEKNHKIERVYGGVVYTGPDRIVPFTERQDVLYEEKRRIARRAAEIVEDNDIIIVDSGTTTQYLIEFLKEKQNLTIVTNSVMVLHDACRIHDCRVVAIGGDVLNNTFSMVGIEALTILEKLHVNKAFIATTGISYGFAVTNSSLLEAEIKKTMMKVSTQNILLADRTKFNHGTLVAFGEIKDFDMVVTDGFLDEEVGDYCKENGVRILYGE